jgi:uncharacterized protein involved in exopolysaccharide biosynthesis
VTTIADEVARHRRDEVDVIAIGLFLSRYKILVVGVAIVGGLLAGLVAIWSEPVYRAEIAITQVHGGSLGGGSPLAAQLGGLASLAGVDLGLDAGEAEEARAVLESRHLVELFVERNALKEPLLEGSGETDIWYAVERFRDSILAINLDRLRGVTTVAIDWRDPVVAAEWANGFINLANERLRERAITESQRSIDYLNAQIERTTVVELQRVMYNLLEREMQNSMLANARTEYAFTVVDPAVVPETKVSPRPALMVGLGLMLGLILGLMLALFYDLRRKHGAPVVHDL